jgi:alkaline phosphatase D
VNDSRSIEAWLRTSVSRRAFLGGLALCGIAPARLSGALAPRRDIRFPTSPFTLGVASGDPTAEGVVLWTRLAPDPLTGGGMPPVDVEATWLIAADDRMRKVVRRGQTVARPEWAHSVHVEAEGLDPARWYWYQFRVGDQLSPIGRTRTLPREGAALSGLRFAFVSCQNYEIGYFTAYKHAAAEELDVLFHLGDYIYEGAGSPGRPRSHAGPELITLDDYRTRYAVYKTDADLQAAHAAFPWIVTWDDHEVQNNYAGAISQDNDPPEVFLTRRAAAYQAYYEHMPLRTPRPTGPSLRIYRRFSFGSLASFFVLDTRQYRTDQPCGDGGQALCPGVFDPNATLLGANQERWLLGGLAGSRARWNVLPQQVMMAPVDRAPGPDRRYAMDQWAGYDVERTRLLQFFGARRTSNPVVLTGDSHSNWVNDLKVDAADPRSPVVATEFVGTSITSGSDGFDGLDTFGGIASENPFVKFYNSQRGYVSCEITPKQMRAEYRVLDYVTRPDSPRKTRAVFVVEDGRAGAHQTEGA